MADEAQHVAREMLIESVTETILRLMEDSNISKAEMARRMGVSRAHITQLLNGKRNMTLKTASDLAYHLGYELSVRAHPIGRAPQPTRTTTTTKELT